MQNFDVLRAVKQIWHDMSNLYSRCIITSADDTTPMQQVTVEGFGDEVLTNIPHPQSYGFHMVPLEGAEGILLSASGERETAIAIVVDDRKHKPSDMQPGEVAVYSVENKETYGHRIILKKGGLIEIHCKDLKAIVENNVDAQVGGNVTASVVGNVDATVNGSVTATIDGNVDATIKGAVTATVDGHVSTEIKGGLSATVTGDVSANISGAMNASVGSDVAISSGTKVSLTAPSLEANITGSATMSVSGSITLGDAAGAQPVARIGDLVAVGSGSSAGSWPIVSGSPKVKAS